MAVIVFEGPDSSGKTTLAKTLQDLLDPVFEDLQVQRSPVKDHGWSETYSHYLADMADTHHGLLLLQDRVPEISETVYAIGMGRSVIRGHGWVTEVVRWLTQDVFLIYCTGEERFLTGTHHDVEGTIIRDQDLIRINQLYEMVFYNLYHLMLQSHPHAFRIASYSRHDPADWVRIFAVINEWLCWQFPDKVLGIQWALTLDKNPMLERI